MIALSLREQMSLVVLTVAIFAVCSFELMVLARSAHRRFHGRSARRVLFAKSAIVAHVVVVLAFACLLYGYLIEPRWIDVQTMTLHTAKIKDVGFRIVQISDLHCDRTALNEERVVRIVNSLRPDIVVATGDYLNDPAGLPRLRETLARLEAPLGKFAVTGNFEVFHWPDLDVLADSTFRELDRETVVVTKGSDAIAVTGLGYVPSDAPHEPVEGFSDERFDVFLFHTPDLIEDVSGHGVDLYLCGHTHGGQIALPGYGAIITLSKFGKKYESGLYRVGDTVLFVNRGLGLEPRPAPQIRFCARPQIAVFDVLPEQATREAGP